MIHKTTHIIYISHVLAPIIYMTHIMYITHTVKLIFEANKIFFIIYSLHKNVPKFFSRRRKQKALICS